MTELEVRQSIRACVRPHVGVCVCGFDGVHVTRTEVLEGRRCRGACTCAWRGPIRVAHQAVGDCNRHRGRVRV